VKSSLKLSVSPQQKSIKSFYPHRLGVAKKIFIFLKIMSYAAKPMTELQHINPSGS
jgi:hypothetical protein